MNLKELAETLNETRGALDHLGVQLDEFCEGSTKDYAECAYAAHLLKRTVSDLYDLLETILAGQIPAGGPVDVGLTGSALAEKVARGGGKTWDNHGAAMALAARIADESWDEEGERKPLGVITAQMAETLLEVAQISYWRLSKGSEHGLDLKPYRETRPAQRYGVRWHNG